MSFDEINDSINEYIAEIKKEVRGEIYPATNIDTYWIDLATQRWKEQQKSTINNF